MNKRKNPWFAISMVLLGVVVGYGLAIGTGYLGVPSTFPAKVGNQQAKKEDKQPAVEVIPIRNSDHVLGNENAKITIIEYSDYECPFCTRNIPTLERILDEYGNKVNWSFRHFPLSFHAHSQKAAEASECAAEQGKFWEYHDLLFSDLSKLNQAGFTEHARKLGLEMARFDSCLSSGKYKGQVEEDVQAGAEAGISGAPAFFINGVLLSGAQPISEFERVIDTELAAMEGNSPSP